VSVGLEEQDGLAACCGRERKNKRGRREGGPRDQLGRLLAVGPAGGKTGRGGKGKRKRDVLGRRKLGHGWAKEEMWPGWARRKGRKGEKV
jgi:hypothetical protein